MTARTRLVCETCGWSQEYAGGTKWNTHHERVDKAKGGHRVHCPSARFKRVHLPVEVKDG